MISSRILWFASLSEMSGFGQAGSTCREAWKPSEPAQKSWKRSHCAKKGMCSSAQICPGATSLW